MTNDAEMQRTPAGGAGYRYWRDHGTEWGEEYRSRKQHQIYYHIQELMLAEYFANSAPAKVLEYGCGTGRHLRYLREISGIDVYGYDQSSTMVANMLDWAAKEWFEDRVAVGEPVSRLPYPNDHFDIVFTSEVLVHVHPDDLDSILRELVRVARWQVLHLEPSPTAQLVSDEHAGCWYHDLAAAYRRLGLECSPLPAGFSVQTPSRVVLAQTRPLYEWSEARAALWRHLEEDLQPELDRSLHSRETNEELGQRIDALQAETERMRVQLGEVEERLDDSEEERSALRAYISDLEHDLVTSNTALEEAEAGLVREHRRAEAFSSQLYIVQSSTGYRILERVRRSPLGRPIASLLKPVVAGFRWIRRSLTRETAVVDASIRKAPLPRTPPRPGHVRLSPRGGAEDRVGTELWLLAVERPGTAEPYDLTTIDVVGRHELRDGTKTPSKHALVFETDEGYADLSAVVGDEVVLMRHPWGGLADLEWQGVTVEVNTHGPEGRVRCILTDAGIDVTVETDRDRQPHRPHRFWPAPPFSDEELAWIAEFSANPSPLSVGHPDWRGIRSSASELFDELYFIEDELDAAGGMHYARLFAEAGTPAVVIQGFPQSYRHLVLALNDIAPKIPVFVIWHGNFLQAREDYAWASFRMIEELARDGRVEKLGFVKKGMAEVVAGKGVHTGFVMNRVRRIPEGASQPARGGPHLGIWNIAENWHKPPFAQIAAASTVPGAVLHISGVSARAHETIEFWRLDHRLHTSAIPQEKMPAVLESMHLNFNVTLSECAPMLPLESLSLGVPCLFGPTSHYFDDHDYLKSRLVVPSPDSAWTIGAFANRALEERTEIVEAYREYAPGYNERALESLERFLDLPMARIG